MQQLERWEDILAEVKRQQRFMDMLCSSATADYRSKGGKIFCQKGCAGCCTLAVNCTAAEAVLLAAELDDRRKEELTSYIERLKMGIAGVSDLRGYLRMHRKELCGCPFLDDGICGVYPARPISCRALLSTMESRWCGADFSELGSGEKQAFADSLDRSAVAFPMHYLASPQSAGRELEMQASMQMAKEFGFSLYGSMPVLVHLFTESSLMEAFGSGPEAVLAAAASAGLDSPFLLQIEKL